MTDRITIVIGPQLGWASHWKSSQCQGSSSEQCTPLVSHDHMVTWSEWDDGAESPGGRSGDKGKDGE